MTYVKNKPIVFLDSGVGGLPYYRAAREKMPLANFIYVADNGNFPYGGRDVFSLKEIVQGVIKKIIAAFDPSAVVIACNTASVVTLSSLREKYGIPFIGVVPAVKPASKHTKNGIIGLLATETTVKSIYTDDLIREFASDCTVKKFAGVKIVELVENNLLSASEEDVKRVLKPAVDYFVKESIDTLILGCTHFLFVKETLGKMFFDKVDIIDSVEGVTNQLFRVAGNFTLGNEAELAEGRGDAAINSPGVKPASVFYVTGKKYNRERYGEFASSFDLVWGGDF